MKRFMICGLTTAAMTVMMSAVPMTALERSERTVPYIGAYANVCTIQGGAPIRSESIPGQLPDENSSKDTFAARITELVNAERRKAGKAPLASNSRADEAAQTRAGEIAQVFSHTRPDGSSYSTALSEAGIDSAASGENIAYGQNSPEAVMEAWMNSSGHRANILNGNYGSIGIGHFRDASGTDYWVQLFTD